MTTRTPILPVLALLLCAPERGLAQATDSLDAAWDADVLPPESVMEHSTGDARPGRGGALLVWRSGWSRSPSTSGGRHALRFSRTGGTFELRLAGDHDPGERLVTRTAPRLFDHVVVSARWAVSRRLQWIAGSFRRSFFHGLTAGSERFGAASSDPGGSTRTGAGLRAWAAASEDLYLNGTALQADLVPGLTWSAWASRRLLDAAVDSSGPAPTARWVQGGRHVTALERSRAGAVSYREVGVAVRWILGAVSIGGVLLHEAFGLRFCPGACDGPAGHRRRGHYGSVYVGLSARAGSLGVEARPTAGGWDVVAAGTATVRPAGSLRVLARRYGPSGGPILASPPSAGSGSVPDEHGLLVHWRMRMAPGVILDLASDHARVPFGSPSLSGRAARLDQRVSLEVRQASWEGVATLRRTVRTEPGSGVAEPDADRIARRRVRLKVSFPVGRSVVIAAMADGADAGRSDAQGTAAMGITVDWSPNASWRLRAGSTEYAAASGTPVVTYEPDTPLAYPLRVLHGSGRRAWVLVEWQGRGTSVSGSAGRGLRFPDGPREDGVVSVAVSLSVTRRL